MLLYIRTLSLIVDGEFLFQHHVSHLFFPSHRQGTMAWVFWEHPASPHGPREFIWGSGLFSFRSKSVIMLGCDTKSKKKKKRKKMETNKHDYKHSERLQLCKQGGTGHVNVHVFLFWTNGSLANALNMNLPHWT